MLEFDVVATNYEIFTSDCEDGRPLGELRAMIFSDRTNVVILIRQACYLVVHDFSPK